MKAAMMRRRPRPARIVVEVDAAPLVTGFECCDRRLVPWQVAKDSVQTALAVEIMVAGDQNLAAVYRMKAVADVVGIAGNGKVADDIEHVIPRYAIVDGRN